jgi:hypothetical protein
VNVQHLSPEIEVFELGARRLYAKTTGGTFAIFEDELTPDELMAIARDITARKAEHGEPVAVESAGAQGR